METIDPNQAARVWQRVRNTPAPAEEPLESLITREWECAGLYLQLSRRCGGKESAALHRLHHRKQANCACLKGIHAMKTGGKVNLEPVKPTQEPVQTALRQCFRREFQCLKSYESRESDPEYGDVFSGLAARQREHCTVLLELIGNWGKNGKL